MATKFAPNKTRLCCGRLCCSSIGTQTCSACFRIDYCSAECQKADWGTHKPYCSKQMNQRLRLFDMCPKQSKAISECLDTAEDYLSRDPELTLRLRVSSHFLCCISSIQMKIGDIGGYTQKLGGISSRMEAIMHTVGKAVESDRVCTDEERFDFSEAFGVIHFQHLFFLMMPPHSDDFQQRLDLLHEALRVARSMKDVYKKARTVATVLAPLSQLYEDAGDLVKAAEAIEEAYICLSEQNGPADPHLQQITLQMCELLGKLGEYDRMLEYLHVGLDNMKCHPDRSGDAERKTNSIFTTIFVINICADYLPVDHTERKAIYAEALHLAFQLLQAQIDHAKAAPDFDLRDREIPLFISIPDDIEIADDYNKPLKLLQQVYDIYLEKGTVKLLLGVVKDITIILSRISVRLVRGYILPSSLDWSVVTSVISNMKRFSESALTVNFDRAKAKEELQKAEGSGDDFDAAVEADKRLVVSRIQAVIKEYQYVYDAILRLRPLHVTRGLGT